MIVNESAIKRHSFIQCDCGICIQGRSLQAQVEAEEIFKMISVMKY